MCHRALVFDRGQRRRGAVAATSLRRESAGGGVRERRAGAASWSGVEIMQSLKSNALEPTRSELAALSRGQAIVRMLPVYGLPILTVLLIAFFSFLLPDSFPTAINARSILSDKAIIALLSLAAMVPMMAGRIDLTVGFGIVMWHILAISLQVQYDVPWPLAVPDRRSRARRCRLDQRHAGRGRADRFFHRHARHRHDPVCACAVAHRRAVR